MMHPSDAGSPARPLRGPRDHDDRPGATAVRRRATSIQSAGLFLVALALVAPSVADALVEGGALLYREDFEGEPATFDPFTPETDVLGAGSLVTSSVFTGPQPTVSNGVLVFSLASDALPFGGQERILQEATVSFLSPNAGGSLSSTLGERSFGVRGVFTDAFFQEPNFPGTVSVTAGTTPGLDDSFYSIAIGLVTELAIVGPPDMSLVVSVSETSFPDLVPILRRDVSTPLSPAVRDAIAGGAEFTIDLLVDRFASLAWSSLQVEGFAEIPNGPVSIAELDRPIDRARALVAYRAEPNFAVSGPTVGLDSFEVRLPYGRDFVVDDASDRTDILRGNGVCATIFGNCTLRAAIEEANASPGLDRILFAEPQVLPLLRTGAVENAAVTGDLDILDDVEILGLGVDQTIIDGRGADRVFDIPAAEAATIVRIADLTIQGGAATDPLEFEGGGIFNAGRLTLERCRVTDNQASVGGGVLNRLRLVVDRCLIDDNVALGVYGFTKGGIGTLANPGAGGPPTTWVFDSAVVDNSSAGVEGGISVEGGGELRLRNTTVSGNSAFQVVAEDVDVTLDHVTLGGPGGMSVGTSGPAAQLTISNSAVEGLCSFSQSPAPSVGFSGFNVASDSSCAFGVPGGLLIAPLGLSPLLPMGSSRGHALLPGTPLVDAADASVCLSRDQVGTSRPLDGDADGSAACDVGAIEVPESGFAIGLVLGAGALAFGVGGPGRGSFETQGAQEA